MYIPKRVLHDLKTERSDVAPPLPPYMRLVPIALYVSVVGCIVFASLFAVQLVHARADLQQQTARGTEAKKQLDQATIDRKNLEGEAKRASDFVNWVEGSRNIEPLVTVITRSIGEKSALIELKIDRADDSPTQVKLAIKLLTTDGHQLDRTLEAVAKEGFHSYSARESQDKGVISYETTLLWESRNVPIPVPAATPAGKPTAAAK
jgi:hypothetical protein